MLMASDARKIGPALLGVVALAATSLLGFSPAQAHDELVSSNPSQNAQLSQAPQSLELTYSGEIMDLDGVNQVRVSNAAGESMTEGSPQVEGKQVIQDLKSDQQEGTYTVSWRVVSSDGHPIQGTFTYQVGQASDLASQAAGSSASSSAAESSAASSTESAAADPLSQLGSGLSGPLKLVLALLGLGALGAVLTLILMKMKRK
ncbi:MAG: copper resistance protein CopC [Rothia sp. (in: high G+C Gram-positive bacteria)]|nr:copper resistance protein CopC [Rothia sp. (in: high G+C Gram-positive bacteria)]